MSGKYVGICGTPPTCNLTRARGNLEHDTQWYPWILELPNFETTSILVDAMKTPACWHAASPWPKVFHLDRLATDSIPMAIKLLALEALAVHLISQKWMPNGTEMCSDLVKPQTNPREMAPVTPSELKWRTSEEHLNYPCRLSYPSHWSGVEGKRKYFKDMSSWSSKMSEISPSSIPETSRNPSEIQVFCIGSLRPSGVQIDLLAAPKG